MCIRDSLYTLREHGRKLQELGEIGQAATILWLTDSTNLTAFLEKGSAKKEIQKDILAVFKLAQELQLVLLPVHLRREDPRIQLADTGSKWEDTDDWSIDAESTRLVKEWIGQDMDVDFFADPNNAKCGQFYSKYDCPGTQGVDALAMSWRDRRAWICPPVTRVIETCLLYTSDAADE